ncbi:unnamed protein product [Adineta steineri]|uniref:Uncharacterized protein n=1 Tax=Adineta steineri TaxID=433720 RepID=A0A813T9K7_9BILA|nr:unnamed protein product [Adineta steineri]CAF3488778.1 unnamed protein product [Adineta steineri]
MGVDHQYYPRKHPHSSPTRLLRVTIPSSSNFLYDKSDFIWNNPTELNLLDVKKAPLTTPVDENTFVKLLPCIRRLYTVFNALCPNIYRIHSSDSSRVLYEIICLIEQYLHIHPLPTISINELIHNEDYFHKFIHKLTLSPSYQPYLDTFLLSTKTEIRCFGQGIHACDYNNQLNQTTLFCFELKTSLKNLLLLPIDIRILDSEKNIVPNDTKYINTYNHGYTKLFSCSYKPVTQAGTYTISFFYNHIEVTNNPFTVFIRNPCQQNEELLSVDVKKMNGQDSPYRSQMLSWIRRPKIPSYELEGDGCSTKVIVNSIARFRLRILSPVNSSQKSTVDSFSLSIIDPYGHSIVVQRRILSPDLLELTYQPMSTGEHQLSILFNNKLQRQLTIDVKNDETNYLSKLKPFGPGLKRAIVGLPTEFYVDLNQQITTNAINNQNHIQFSLQPSYHAEIDYEQQMATLRYTPLKEGDCPIHILEYNKDTSHSPYIAHVKQENLSQEKPRIHVNGLTQQISIHRPVEFRVFVDNPFDDPTHCLHIEILTPDENSPSVSIRRQHDSSYICSFIPVSLGRHLISVDYAGIVAENNPFYCHSIQEKDIQLTGPAVNNQCLTLNRPTHFYFKLKDFLKKKSPETNLTYESGYSSYDDTSLNSSLADGNVELNNNEDNDYRITITDIHGNLKPNVSINENINNNIRVDFTPNEQIMFINISCTWYSHTFEPQCTSTPKKVDTTSTIIPNLCSTPRPAHIRYSLSKCTPLPIDSSTPNTKKIKKSFTPNIHRLIYPSNITTRYTNEIWI